MYTEWCMATTAFDTYKAVMTLQKRAVFLRKRLRPVMLHLSADVIPDRLELGLADSESSIAILPGKPTHVWERLFQPMR